MIGIPECGLVGICASPCSEQCVPGLLFPGIFLCNGGIVIIDILRNHEGSGILPAQVLTERCHIFHAERLAVCACLPFLCRAAGADLRLDLDHGRTGGIRLGLLNGCENGSGIISVLYTKSLETKGFKTLLYGFAEGDIGPALDGNVIGIIKYDQLGQSQGSGQREGFVGNAFHHASVAAKYIGIMIHHRMLRGIKYGCEVLLRHRHTDSHRHAGTQRAGGSFHAGRMTVFRMTGSQGPQLTEVHEILPGKTVAEQVEQGIKKHGSMSAGQDETVTVLPFGILRIVVHDLCPQGIGSGSCAQRKARVSGICFLNCVC